MNDRAYEQGPAAQAGFGGGVPGLGGFAGSTGGGGPAGEWLREAPPAWAAPGAPWPRYDLAEPQRPRLTAAGAAPWLAAGLLCAFLVANRSPEPAPAVPTPVAAVAGLPTPAAAACGPVAP
jgi:hypothetical protein